MVKRNKIPKRENSTGKRKHGINALWQEEQEKKGKKRGPSSRL